jgi:membrane-associated protease RseP (regulator of RpoE activity)
MKQAQQSVLVLTTGLIAATLCGCATQPIAAQRWGKQIDAAPKDHMTKEDISRMLGNAPARCETIPGRPTLGILLRHNSGTKIRGIFPNSPAAATDMRIGDRILSVNAKPVHSMEDVIASTEGMKDPHSSISIKTQRETYVVTPHSFATSEQCSWSIRPERAQLPRGSAAQRDEHLPSVFHAICRFNDGKAYICHWRWEK